LNNPDSVIGAWFAVTPGFQDNPLPHKKGGPIRDLYYHDSNCLCQALFLSLPRTPTRACIGLQSHGPPSIYALNGRAVLLNNEDAVGGAESFREDLF